MGKLKASLDKSFENLQPLGSNKFGGLWLYNSFHTAYLEGLICKYSVYKKGHLFFINTCCLMTRNLLKYWRNILTHFQVITGGQYDVDMELTAPNGQVLYKDVKKQYDSFTWKADQTGIHKFCFSNEFSTFSHKVVYFDFQVGEEKPLIENMNEHATAMTLVCIYLCSLFSSVGFQTNFWVVSVLSS